MRNRWQAFIAIYFPLFWFAYGGLAHGQGRPAGIHMVADSVLHVDIGDIPGITLSLVNDTDSPWSGRLDIQVPTGVSLLGSRDGELVLPAKGRMFIPIKLRIAADAVSGQSAVSIRLLGGDDRPVAMATTVLSVASKKSVILQAQTASTVIRNIGDSLRIPVQVRNVGNTEEQVRIVASMPGPEGDRRFVAHALHLPPAHDTVVVFGYLVDRRMMAMEHFMVYISGLYPNGDVFGNAGVGVSNAAATRSFLTPGFGYNDILSRSQGRLILAVRSPFTDNQALQFAGNGSYRLHGGTLDFSAYAFQWGGLSAQPFVTNTWVNYDHRGNGVTVGNLSESLDRFINGRGVKAYLSDSVRAERFEAGVLDKSFNLLGNAFDQGMGNGFAAYAKTQLGHGVADRKRYTGTAVFDRDPSENSENILFTNTFDFIAQKHADRLQLVGEFGSGITRKWVGAEKAMDYKPSVAMGLQLNTRLRAYTVSSINYYSSGYYPGIRRGALQTNQRIGRGFGKTNVWAAYSLYEYAPKYVFATSYQHYFSTSRAEFGTSFPLSAFASLSLSPRYELEKGRYWTTGNVISLWEMPAYRLQSMLNWRSRNYKHGGYLTIENGMAESPFTAEWQWNTRANLSYTYDWLSIYANYQYGSYSLMEAVAFHTMGFGGRHQLGISAFVRKELMDKRLLAELMARYFSDGTGNSNQSVNARLQYALNRTTGLFIETQSFRFQNAFFQGTTNTYIQTGLVRSLAQRDVQGTGKRGQISLFGYHDHNSNGQYDEGDEPASNKSFLIGNTLFISGSDGRVQYDKVPRGSYELRVPVEDGWYAPATTIQLDGRRVQLDIALQRAGSLQGRVFLNYDERYSMEANTALEGYTITATGANGYVTQARTDISGRYTLFAPAGTYEIALSANQFPNHVYANDLAHVVQIVSGKINEAPTFELNVERKKIEVKRFSQ